MRPGEPELTRQLDHDYFGKIISFGTLGWKFVESVFVQWLRRKSCSVHEISWEPSWSRQMYSLACDAVRSYKQWWLVCWLLGTLGSKRPATKPNGRVLSGANMGSWADSGGVYRHKSLGSLSKCIRSGGGGCLFTRVRKLGEKNINKLSKIYCRQ